MSSNAPLHVAVIDDDHSVCRSFARLLRAAGMAPTTYASAEAFLDDAQHPRFDCMVFDVQLGGISGIELIVRLRAGGGEVAPIIIVTAHDDPQMRLQAEAAGCAAYFRKNDAGADVLGAIRRLAALRTAGS
jgi:FixJ family two-component response regulator